MAPRGFRRVTRNAAAATGGVASDAPGNDGGESTPDFDAAGHDNQPDAADNREPYGDAAVSPESFESSSAAPGGGSGTGKRRGRKPGSRNKSTTGKSASETTSFIAEVLFSGHQMLAAAVKIEELELSEEESKQLADAVVRVSEQYDFRPVVDPKIQAWGMLLVVAGKIYGPRIGAHMVNKKAAKARRPAIVPFMDGVDGKVVDGFVDLGASAAGKMA